MNKINSCAILGLNCSPIEIEIDISRGKGLFSIIGLPDKSIKEAELRLRSAIKNSGLLFPATKRVIINLAPADTPKMGSAYDLPMAAGIVLRILESDYDASKDLFIGEISLDGSVRKINGVLLIATYAREQGFQKIYLPAENLAEAKLVDGIKLVPITHLSELVDFFQNKIELKTIISTGIKRITKKEDEILVDFSEIKGQFLAKRALEIAAAGGHNVIMNGPPGSGKTMLSKALASILPPLSIPESLEITKIYSIANKLDSKEAVISGRPFRSPHHSSSGASLIGGGRIPAPGEISLAHRGVLFLDEFAEFPRQTLDNLRQPLEEGVITIGRAAGSLSFPAKFILIASKNPCPCGFATDREKKCSCSSMQLQHYNKKISGPILDRIDLHVEVPRLDFKDLEDKNSSEDSKTIRARVIRAREIQAKRFVETAIITNSEMMPREMKKYCQLDDKTNILLRTATEKLKLSARSYHRILKTSRTIADLAGEEDILIENLAEALQYQNKD